MIGLVLAGGQSSRLGQDKTAIPHEGQTLLERTARLLAPHVAQVFVSCRHPGRVSGNWPVIIDETERIGPAGGIVTALRRLGGPIFVLACDLPFMGSRFITRLLTAREERPGSAVLTAWSLADTEYVESLVAIYEPQALPLLEEGIARGLFKLGRLIPPEKRHLVRYSAEDQDAFFNVNRPEDLRRLRAQP